MEDVPIGNSFICHDVLIIGSGGTQAPGRCSLQWIAPRHLISVYPGWVVEIELMLRKGRSYAENEVGATSKENSARND